MRTLLCMMPPSWFDPPSPDLRACFPSHAKATDNIRQTTPKGESTDADATTFWVWEVTNVVLTPKHNAGAWSSLSR